MDLSGTWIDKVHPRQALKELILDLDSSVSESYGKQEDTAYHGHFECNGYPPLFLFNQLGDLERCMLRWSSDNRTTLASALTLNDSNL